MASSTVFNIYELEAMPDGAYPWLFPYTHRLFLIEGSFPSLLFLSILQLVAVNFFVCSFLFLPPAGLSPTVTVQERHIFTHFGLLE